MLEVILSLCLYAAPPPAPIKPDLQKAKEMCLNGDHEASEMLLGKLKDHTNPPAYYYFRMINAFKLNNKKEALKWSGMLKHTYEDIPNRYKDLAIIINAEAETWTEKKSDDLEDISREMTKIKDRLHNNKGGPETQKLQKDVLSRLDKMIKDAEDQKNKDKEDKDKEEKEKKRKQAERDGIWIPADKGGKGNPADKAVTPTEQGTGQIDKKKVKEIAAVWGKLPEKERAQALRDLTRGMPPKDRAIIERYLKELQKRSGSK